MISVCVLIWVSVCHVYIIDGIISTGMCEWKSHSTACLDASTDAFIKSRDRYLDSAARDSFNSKIGSKNIFTSEQMNNNGCLSPFEELSKVGPSCSFKVWIL